MRDQCLEDTRTEPVDLTWDFLERHHSEECDRIDRSWAESDLTRDMLIDHAECPILQSRVIISRARFRRNELHRLWSEGKYHLELMEAGR